MARWSAIRSPATSSRAPDRPCCGEDPGAHAESHHFRDSSTTSPKPIPCPPRTPFPASRWISTWAPRRRLRSTGETGRTIFPKTSVMVCPSRSRPRASIRPAPTPTGSVSTRRSRPTFLVHSVSANMRYDHHDSAPPGTLNYNAVTNLGLVGAAVSPAPFPQINIAATRKAVSTPVVRRRARPMPPWGRRTPMSI